MVEQHRDEAEFGATVLVSQTNQRWVQFGATVLVILGLLTAFAIARGSVVFAIVFGVAWVAVLAGFAPRFRAAARWHPAELHIERYPLTLGAPVNVSYIHRTKKKPPQDASLPLPVTLSCEERATYTVGTDTRTDTETVSEEVWPLHGSLQAGVFVAEGELAIPLDRGAPTFKTDHNEVVWKLSANPDAPLPPYSASFTLTALADVRGASLSSSGIQDAPLSPDVHGEG